MLVVAPTLNKNDYITSIRHVHTIFPLDPSISRYLICPAGTSVTGAKETLAPMEYFNHYIKQKLENAKTTI